MSRNLKSYYKGEKGSGDLRGTEQRKRPQAMPRILKILEGRRVD